MNVDLTPELEQLVQTRVNSGRYNSASEVVREALRLLEQRDKAVTLRKGEIRSQIEEGWQSATRGEFVDGDEVFDRIDAELEVMERGRSQMRRFVLTKPAARDLNLIKAYLIEKAVQRSHAQCSKIFAVD